MYNGKGQRVLYDKSRIRRQIKVVTVLIILSRPTTTNMNVGMWKTWECWKLSAGGSFLLITTQLQHENQFGWDKGDDDHTWSLDQMFGGFHLVLPLLTRSSWLNGALRDDEAVYWVSTGNYEALAIGNWLYWVSRGIYAFIYCTKWRPGQVLPMPYWLTDWLTDSQTLKDRATQFLIKYKSGALVTQSH